MQAFKGEIKVPLYQLLDRMQFFKHFSLKKMNEEAGQTSSTIHH